MKKLLLVLAPLALLAQVEIDTVIRLPSYLRNGYFIPQLNKLYVLGEYRHYVLDCSTYVIRAEIPRTWQTGTGQYAWNRLRQKLYISVNPRPEDSALVVDAAADSVLGWLTLGEGSSFHQTYMSDVDRLYWDVMDTAYFFDCAADTVVHKITSPAPPHKLGWGSWDSVGRKLFVSLGYWGSPSLLAVYDYPADSFTKVIDVSSVATGPNLLVFNHAHHKAYFGPSTTAPFDGYAGILDTQNDTLLRVLPSHIANGDYNPIAVDEQDGKVYIAGGLDHPNAPDTLWVVDCATDSILKTVEYKQRGYGALYVRWVPWSNRIYLGCQTDMDPSTPETSIVVLDCKTDSVIARMVLGHEMLDDIQVDPIRERVFAVGVDSYYIYVLRDVPGGVAEGPPSADPAAASGLLVHQTPRGFELGYSIASPCRVDLSVYDQMGREVRRLVAEEQPPGRHRVTWDCRDSSGNRVSHGVYFYRLDTPSYRSVKKAVVTR